MIALSFQVYFVNFSITVELYIIFNSSKELFKKKLLLIEEKEKEKGKEKGIIW